MKKLGFTLIELLGVITIFGILSALAIPPILNQINGNKEAVSDTNMKVIGYATHLYFSEKIEANQTYCVTLQKLVDLDLLESPVRDFENDTTIPLSRFVQMTTDENGKESYQILEDGQTCTPSTEENE